MRTNKALSGKPEWTQIHRVTKGCQASQDMLRMTRAYHDLGGVLMPMMELPKILWGPTKAFKVRITRIPIGNRDFGGSPMF